MRVSHGPDIQMNSYYRAIKKCKTGSNLSVNYDKNKRKKKFRLIKIFT